MRTLRLHLLTLAATGAVLATGCAQRSPTPDAPVSASVAMASAPAPALSPEDRFAFFVDHARRGDTAAVRHELDAGIDVNQRDTLDQTALIAAVSHRSAEVVDLLLSRGANANLADGAGWTPLIYGAYFGADEALLKMLLDHGADIDARNDRGITALYLASATGHEAQVKFLLEHGADRSLASASGYTPVRIAQLKGLGKIVAMLDPAAAKTTPVSH